MIFQPSKKYTCVIEKRCTTFINDQKRRLLLDSQGKKYRCLQLLHQFLWLNFIIRGGFYILLQLLLRDEMNAYVIHIHEY